ncbi:hypothetical protein [Microbacterium caowuchunii]|uniref:hypothetical protein n=1 Tax=Microbacterium caowuchunii TaxID=2614638 RepID=UPI001780BFD5|nr:hypothetical protein [Microbacterium caowuchunii]
MLWVDDFASNRGLRYAHSPRALAGIRRINPWTGITMDDVTAMNTWLALAATPDGQDPLRRQWRRERDQLRRLHRQELPPGWRALIV